MFLAAEPDTVTGLFGFSITNLNKAKLRFGSESGVDDIRFLIFSLLFSLTAPDLFFFWSDAST